MNRIFLSHYEKYPQLGQFVLALRELVGVEPVLLENCPSIGGTPPNELAEHYMKSTDGVIFLLTADALTNDKKQPSSSVSIELVMAERLIPIQKRFYLLEKGTTFPAMAKIPTYVEFSSDDMITALVKLRRALEAADLVQAGSIPDLPKETLSVEAAFILETVAKDPKGYWVRAELSAAYANRFHRDHADFNILLNNLRGKNMIHEEYRIVRDDTLAKTRVVIVGAEGFRVLGEHRDAARGRDAKAAVEGLKHLGLIPK